MEVARCYKLDYTPKCVTTTTIITKTTTVTTTTNIVKLPRIRNSGGSERWRELLEGGRNKNKDNNNNIKEYRQAKDQKGWWLRAFEGERNKNNNNKSNNKNNNNNKEYWQGSKDEKGWWLRAWAAATERGGTGFQRRLQSSQVVRPPSCTNVTNVTRYLFLRAILALIWQWKGQW